jgi:DNA-binding XRE family transcriptional regulator
MQPSAFKSARQRLGLNQSQLAAELGVTRQTINVYERGHCPIPVYIALAIEALLTRAEA